MGIAQSGWHNFLWKRLDRIADLTSTGNYYAAVDELILLVKFFPPDARKLLEDDIARYEETVAKMEESNQNETAPFIFAMEVYKRRQAVAQLFLPYFIRKVMDTLDSRGYLEVRFRPTRALDSTKIVEGLTK